MNDSKLSKRLIISCFTTTCLLAFMLLSCETEEIGPQSINKEQQDLSKKGNSPDRIDICHYDEDTGGWMQITVSERAWEDHSLHGDQWLDRDGDGFTAANECGIGSMDDCDDTDANVNPASAEICDNGFDDDCDGNVDGADSDCGPRIFAIAYSNLNGEPGFQENSADVLISKVVDFNNDNLLNEGDKVITNQYPKDFDASAFGNFTVKEHPITFIGNASTTLIQVFIGQTALFRWEIGDSSVGYDEGGRASGEVALRNSDFGMYLLVQPSSPSRPEDDINLFNSEGDISDDTFIAIEIFLD